MRRNLLQLQRFQHESRPLSTEKNSFPDIHFIPCAPSSLLIARASDTKLLVSPWMTVSLGFAPIILVHSWTQRSTYVDVFSSIPSTDHIMCLLSL